MRQPQQYVKPEGRMDGVSTNRAEFQEHEIQPRQSFKPANTVQTSTDPFDDRTTARSAKYIRTNSIIYLLGAFTSLSLGISYMWRKVNLKLNLEQS